MTLKPGMNLFSEGTYECSDYAGCLYQESGRCIYNISRIQERTSRACYNDLLQDEIEARADYEEGVM